jgi:hypothetical protein
MALRHALNNLLGKILGAAELALDQAVQPGVRAELDTIIRLAEDGGRLTAALGRADREP